MPKPPLSPTTRFHYERDWHLFLDWREKTGVRTEDPRVPALVGQYLLNLTKAATPPSISTLHRMKSGIAYMVNENQGLALSDSPGFQQAWAAALRQASGLGPREGVQVVETVFAGDLVKLAEVQPDTAAGLRDRALFLVGGGSGLVAAELLRLLWTDVLVDNAVRVPTPEGTVVQVTSKADVADPARALEAWRAVVGTGQALFPSIDRHGNVSDRPMTPGGLNGVVKRAVALAGLPEAGSITPSKVFKDGGTDRSRPLGSA